MIARQSNREMKKHLPKDIARIQYPPQVIQQHKACFLHHLKIHT